MSLASKLALLKEMLESAESNLRSAKQILSELVGGPAPRSQYIQAAAKLQFNSHASASSDASVIEGVFDGQNMLGPDGKSYPVPANYASKSKLVAGDTLKLTIMPDGAFLYKQIGPVERKRAVGTLVYEDGQYRVLAEGKAYKVLLASVTYYRAEIGDQITLLVPEFQESEWGAIEHVLPKGSSLPSDSLEVSDRIPMEEMEAAEAPVRKRKK